MKKALYRLESYYANNATESEKPFLVFLINNPRKVVEMDIHALAKSSFCSAATIVRICKKNGFTGFKELKQALINDVHFSDELIQTKLECLTNNDLKRIVTDIFENNIKAIENTYALLDINEVEAIIQHIIKSSCIYVFGIGASLLVAKDIQQKFERVNKRAVLFADVHMQLISSSNIAPNQVALIVSYSGITKEMIEIANNVKKRGGILISITKYGSTKLSSMSDYNLFVANSEGLLRVGAGASRITQLTLVDVLFQTYLNAESASSMDRILTSQNLLDKEK